MILDEEIQEGLEHNQTLSDIVAVLSTPSGERFMRYLFKHFEVGELPDLGLMNDLLYDKLGSLRPGRALFRLVAQADPRMAGLIMASLETEKNKKERQNVQKV